MSSSAKLRLSASLLGAVLIASASACGGEGGEDRAAGSATPAATARLVGSTASPLDAAFRLSEASPLDVDRLFALFGGVEVSYRTAMFDPKIGATVVSDLLMTSDFESDPGADVRIDVEMDRVRIDRAEFYGVDLDALDRALEADVDPSADMLEVARKVRLFGVKSARADASGDSGIGAVELDRLRIRAGAAGEDADGGAAFLNRFAFDGLYARDVTLQVSDVADAGASASMPEVRFAAPDVRLVGVGGGRIGA